MASQETSTTPADAAMAKRTCNAPGCSNPAKLQCPTCLKNQIPVALPLSFFCSQACFKAAWTEHKVLHALPLNQSKEYTPWPTYKFTGPLRPWPQTPRRTVPEHIRRPDYAETGYPTAEARERGNVPRVLTLEEQEKMRVVCRLAREVLDIGAAAIRPGVTTDEIDRIVHEATIARNAYPSPLNYNGFPKSCCTSVNEVICHGIPDLRPLQEGDICNLDVTLYYDGVHGDLNETFFVGAVSERAQRLVNASRECLEKAIELVKPGTAYRDIGNVVQKHADSAGLSVVRTYCGHGIHSLFHATPNIPHYAKNKAVGVMKAGHVFTIEPMINEGSFADDRWPDDWTSATIDGKLSAQFEHTLLVTETGVEILTSAVGLKSSFLAPSFNAKVLEDAAAAKAKATTAA